MGYPFSSVYRWIPEINHPAMFGGTPMAMEAPFLPPTAVITMMASRENHVGHQGLADVDFTSADAFRRSKASKENFGRMTDDA